jgi:hypothetical protein
LTAAPGHGQPDGREPKRLEADMPLNSSLILLAMLAQIVFTFYVYYILISGRFRAVRTKQVRASQYVLVEGEPSNLARVTNNLRNQFELPVLFYALVLMLVAINRVTLIDVVLAFAFVVARVAHHFAHTKSEDVLLRPRIFAIGFTIVGLLALHGFVIVIGEMLG